MNEFTYTSGYVFKSDESFMTKKVVKLCDFLNEEFGDEYEFEPEPVSEGGILFKKHPGPKGSYKTVRFHTDSKQSWLWIEEDTLQKWREAEDQVIFKGPLVIKTFLKAFHGASAFAIGELDAFERGFESIGFTRSGRKPAKKTLKESGHLGIIKQ
jgi:hypothetical protein